MPANKSSEQKFPTPVTSELLQLLAAAIDGIDGYESETGDLRYWQRANIERARRLLDSPAGRNLRRPS